MLSIQIETNSFRLIILNQYSPSFKNYIRLSFESHMKIRLIDAVQLLDTLNHDVIDILWADMFFSSSQVFNTCPGQVVIIVRRGGIPSVELELLCVKMRFIENRWRRSRGR